MIWVIIGIVAVWLLLGTYSAYLFISFETDVKVEHIGLMATFSLLGPIGLIIVLGVKYNDKILFKKKGEQ